MRRSILLVSVLSSVWVHAQSIVSSIGINTQTPQATLHIEAGESENKGIIVPRITAQEMKIMSNRSTFGENQNGIITYLTDTMPEADRSGKFEDVSEEGYYYYSKTLAKWISFILKQSPNGVNAQDLRFVGNNNHITQDAGVGGVGKSVGTGSNNIALGKSALSSNTTGEQNIALGVDALKVNTIGNKNIALGRLTLGSNISGTDNIAMGGVALYGNTSGSNNIALGLSALRNNTGGHRNIALGYFTLATNTTGNDNIALVHESLKSSTTGTSNIGVGFRALSKNTTGYQNIALGYESLKSNTSGIYNIAIGEALKENTTGQKNVALGNGSLAKNTVGNGNMGIGLNAIGNSIDGNRNIAIGVNTGLWIKGNSNLHIGSSEKNFDYTDELDQVIAIGNNFPPEELNKNTSRDNVILLGHNHVEENVVMRVGVGTYKPVTKLDVAGAVKVGADTSACTADLAGAIRFNSTDKKFQGCDI